MSLRGVLGIVVDALAADGFAAEPERAGFVDVVRSTPTARQVVQLQCSPPRAFRSRLRLPWAAPPMLTVNLLVDHAEAARTFGRPLGVWPAPVEQRIGFVMGNSDHWWTLDEQGDIGAASPDPDVLAMSVVEALREHGLPFLDEASEPAEAHRRDLARDRAEFAAELAWLAGDVAAARAAVQQVRALVADVDSSDGPTPGQQRLLEALRRLERVVLPT